MKKQLQVVRNPKREDIELVVGTDRIVVKIGIELDDSELEKLKAFALAVADKCDKPRVIFRGTVNLTVKGDMTVDMVCQRGIEKQTVVSA